MYNLNQTQRCIMFVLGKSTWYTRADIARISTLRRSSTAWRNNLKKLESVGLIESKRLPYKNSSILVYRRVG